MNAKNIFYEARQRFFSGKHWICVNGSLYCWETNYYRKIDEEDLIPNIQQFCLDHKGVKSSFTHNTAEIIKIQKNLVAIPADKINPPGINCTNGVLIVYWDDRTIPEPKLIQHDPKIHYYTQPPLVKYNTYADPTECDKLLACLDPPEREIFLRTVSAAIDLPKVREIRGREVKALLLLGEGSNGKDALRSLITTIYGESRITDCTLGDFKAYDNGRKFDLAKAKGKLFIWASENTRIDIDRIQSLKRFITGDKLHAESKGKDSVEFTPEAICIFNINEAPNLTRKLQAIIDRFAVIKFNKTYKQSPNPNNHLELLADPRFKHDLNFVSNDVAPAFINKMVDEFCNLCQFGIDYERAEETFTNLQRKNNHLYQFCSDKGIKDDDSGTVSAQQIYEELEKWYINEGILTFDEEGKKIWFDPPSPLDKYVKGINKVIPRFLELFPDAQRVSLPHPIHGTKRKIPGIQGISLSISSKEQQSKNLTTGITQTCTTTAQSASTVTNPYPASPPQPARSIK